MEYLVVDVDKRQINIPESIEHLGVKDDNETRTLNFRMPKIYKGLDMSGYTIEINYINAKGKADSALAENAQVGDEEITFQWCAGGTAYAKDGKVRFLVYAYLENEDLIRTNEWHTTWAALEVLDGGNVEEQIAEENPRIIEEMRRRIRDLENGETGGTKDAVQYIEQELTDEQKAQARTNIGAASDDVVKGLSKALDGLKEIGTGGSEVEISETEPTNENTDLWINPSDDEEVHIYTAEEIDEKMPKKLSDLDIDLELGGSSEVPFFDLVEMGLPVIPVNGDSVYVQADTKELMDALSKGVVDIKYSFVTEGGSDINRHETTVTTVSRLVTSYKEESYGDVHTGVVEFYSKLSNELYAEIRFEINSTHILAKHYARPYDLPIFDFVEMGLPAIPLDGTEVSISVDANKVVEALKKGGIKANVVGLWSGNSNTNMLIPIFSNRPYSGSTYYAYSIVDFDDVAFVVKFEINTVGIGAKVIPSSPSAVPTFDLASIGLPLIPMDGTYVNVSTDTTYLRQCVERGVVKLKAYVNFNGNALPIEFIGACLYNVATKQYIIGGTIPNDGVLCFAFVFISESSISAKCDVLML